MKPRVFVSSTYYDLKHVRDRIERFIDNYMFEAVLFESDNVIFEHETPLDVSCYNEVKLCHMMILIIGGRYGSAVTGENLDEKKGNYNDYVSITRKEYETAIKKKIPIFIFIEKNVHAEYQTFKKNMEYLEKESSSMKFSFAHVDDVNVFKFINSIRGKAIKTFEKVDDIEFYLKNQFAGMMYLYLNQLQEDSKDNRVLDSVEELQSVTKQMNEMLAAVGKNVIKEDGYAGVISAQNRILLDFFVNQFIDNITFKYTIENFTREDAVPIFNVCMDTIFNYELLDSAFSESKWSVRHRKLNDLQELFESSLLEINPKIQISEFKRHKPINSFYERIHGLISADEDLMKFFAESLISAIWVELDELPF